jgi:GNAT superfamily N-acetyltransferase
MNKSKDYFTEDKLKNGEGIRISIRNPDYKSTQHEQTGGYKDEIGVIQLVEETPEYLSVLNVDVDPELQGLGYGVLLYKKAAEVAKKKGYYGIVSHKGFRSPSADRVWKALRSRGLVTKKNGYDVLSNNNRRLDMSFYKKIQSKYLVNADEQTDKAKTIQDAVVELYMIAKDGEPAQWEQLLDTDVGLDLDKPEREKAAKKAFHIYEAFLSLPKGSTLKIPHFGKSKEVRYNH